MPGDMRLTTGPTTSGANEYRLGPDRRVWAYVGDVLVRIHPEDVRVEVLGRVPSPGRIGFAGEDVYLCGTTELRVIRGLASE